MTPRTRRIAEIVVLGAILASLAPRATPRTAPLHTSSAIDEHEIVERGLVNLRLDPKSGALPGECGDLSPSDLEIVVGGRPARVSSVERIPRPLRHWLLLDVSESAEDRRAEEKRSAEQYVREVMSPGLDVATVLAVDEDSVLVAGPTGDPAELARKIEGISPGGWSALRDGLDTVLRQVQGDRHEHLILFWTDGQDQSSLIRAEELLESLSRAPNATVFPIALLPKGAKFPPPPLTGATFTEVARRSGGEVSVSSDPRWLDRVRGWIERRFTVAFVPAEPAPDEPAARRGLSISLREKRCHLTVLGDPFEQPDSIAGAAPPAPAAWMRGHVFSKDLDDAACASESTPLAENWPLRIAPDGLVGCLLDAVQVSGPCVREWQGTRSYTSRSARFAARDVYVRAPELSKLPTDPTEAIEQALAPPGAEREAAPALFLEGNALLAQRVRIAAALFATRADYHGFALARLAKLAEEDLKGIERDFRRSFPDLPPERITVAARASRAGRRAIDAAERPTDADLVRVLAAWIQDVPVGALLPQIERRFIDTRLRRGKDPSLEARWALLRDRFSTPSRVRIAAPLVLVRDPVQDVVGFVRVVLPRPERFRSLDRPPTEDDASLDPRLPTRALALGLVDAIADEPGVAGALALRGYHATSVAYRPLDPLERRDPGKPYARARVTVTLESAGATGGSPSRAVLDADVSAPVDGPVQVVRLAPTVTGDPALAAALHPIWPE